MPSLGPNSGPNSNALQLAVHRGAGVLLYVQTLKSHAVDISTGKEIAGSSAGAAYADYSHSGPSAHVGEQPTIASGQTQFGGQNFSGTSATMHWGVKDIPTPKEMVAQLNEWVIGQPSAKKVGECARQHPRLVWLGLHAAPHHTVLVDRCMVTNVCAIFWGTCHVHVQSVRAVAVG